MQRDAGETQLELDQRMVRTQITRVKRELASVIQHRETQRKKRMTVPVPTCAIVGYTNAGKSSLINKLTNSNILAEDKLFATLDPTSRRCPLPSGQPLVVTDTVGFVRNLPHRLVDAFGYECSPSHLRFDPVGQAPHWVCLAIETFRS